MNININDKLPKAEYIYENGHIMRYKHLDNDDIKDMLQSINLNNGFSVPERMVQDFIQDGSIEPTFKICVHFTKNDLHNMVKHLRKNKKIKKPIPKHKTKKYKKANKKHKKTYLKK
jgi:hypothetical protein